MSLVARRNGERNCHRGGRFGGEPSLEEMLADPVIQTMMSVDHVTAGDIEHLMLDARERRKDS
jgi:hypothetical protein